jgi:hypothetical protein
MASALLDCKGTALRNIVIDLAFWPNEANAINPIKKQIGIETKRSARFIERAAGVEFIDENGGGPGVR